MYHLLVVDDEENLRVSSANMPSLKGHLGGLKR